MRLFSAALALCVRRRSALGNYDHSGHGGLALRQVPEPLWTRRQLRRQLRTQRERAVHGGPQSRPRSSRSGGRLGLSYLRAPTEGALGSDEARRPHARLHVLTREACKLYESKKYATAAWAQGADALCCCARSSTALAGVFNPERSASGRCHSWASRGSKHRYTAAATHDPRGSGGRTSPDAAADRSVSDWRLHDALRRGLRDRNPLARKKSSGPEI